jgi:hypothetical protein
MPKHKRAVELRIIISTRTRIRFIGLSIHPADPQLHKVNAKNGFAYLCSDRSVEPPMGL